MSFIYCSDTYAICSGLWRQVPKYPTLGLMMTMFQELMTLVSEAGIWGMVK